MHRTVTVLFLEDDPVSPKILQEFFRRELPSVRLLLARTIADAQLLIAEYQVELFILDLTLPDGSGLDFAADVQTISPDAPIMLVAQCSPKKLEELRSESGIRHALMKPLDFPSVIGWVRSMIAHLPGAGKQSDSKQTNLGFTAQLQEMGPFEIIQLRAMSGATTMLEFTTRDFRIGSVYLCAGQISHAGTGSFLGMEALVEILSWRSGAVREEIGAIAPVRSIVGNTEVILMHVAQQIDEQRTKKLTPHTFGSPN